MNLSHESYNHIVATDVGSVSYAERGATETFNFQLEKKHLFLEALSLKVGLDGKYDESDFNPPIDIMGVDVGADPRGLPLLGAPRDPARHPLAPGRAQHLHGGGRGHLV